MATLSDSSLWGRRLQERLRSRDQAALAKLYDQFAPVVFGVAWRVTADHDAAEDVTREVFLAVWRHPEAFNAERASMRSWLTTLAHGRAVARHKTAGPVESELDVEELVAALGTAQIVERAFAALPENHRAVIALAYFGGTTYKEVAEDLGLAADVVASQMDQGLRRLAKGMDTEVVGRAT
jgi:RNA polymerase sigma-70 factor (ECF subfamily)